MSTKLPVELRTQLVPVKDWVRPLWLGGLFQGPVAAVRAWREYSKQTSLQLVCMEESLAAYYLDNPLPQALTRRVANEVLKELLNDENDDDGWADEQWDAIEAFDVPAHPPVPRQDDAVYFETDPTANYRLLAIDCAAHEVVQVLMGGHLGSHRLRHSAADHDALLADWRDRYGMRLALLDNDCLYLWGDVDRVLSVAEARTLAFHHLLYENDVSTPSAEEVHQLRQTRGWWCFSWYN